MRCEILHALSIRFPVLDRSASISVANRLDTVTVGIVRACGVEPLHHSEEFDHVLAALLVERSAGLTEDDDSVRRRARDMLRRGTYKPTGRGKPASEYLLRAAQDPASFPRINWLVDVCSYISLLSLLPVSIWDLDRSSGNRFLFRTGKGGEQYVFNTGGQVISLGDLVVGCDFGDASSNGQPIVNPVKDSMRTKTTPQTRRVAAAVYAPADFSATQLEKVCELFADRLRQSSGTASSAYCIVPPGTEASC